MSTGGWLHDAIEASVRRNMGSPIPEVQEHQEGASSQAGMSALTEGVAYFDLSSQSGEQVQGESTVGEVPEHAQSTGCSRVVWSSRDSRCCRQCDWWLSRTGRSECLRRCQWRSADRSVRRSGGRTGWDDAWSCPVVPFGANVVPVQVPQGIQIPPPPLPCQGVPCQGVPCQSVPGMSVSGGSMFPSQRPPNFCGAPPVFDRVM